jgi:hypothetical protein
MAKKEDCVNNTDDEFPILARLSSLKYKDILVEERSDIHSTIEKSDDLRLDNSLLGSRGSKAPCSHSKRTDLWV